MYLRLTFNASGENFNAKSCISKLKSNELNVVYYKDTPNHLSFIHPNSFSNEYWDEEYELSYYNFVAKNIEVLRDCVADDFSLFIDVYVKNNEQCNFQILSRNFLKIIGNNEIDIPISIYNDP